MPSRFPRVTRRSKVLVASAVGLAFAAVTGVGLAQVTAGSANEAGSVSKVKPTTTEPKVTICHHTGSKNHRFHTITVAASAVQTHITKHGDTMGACPVPTPPTSQAVTTTSAPKAKKPKKPKKHSSPQPQGNGGGGNQGKGGGKGK
jgi:hypothetical protein